MEIFLKYFFVIFFFIINCATTVEISVPRFPEKYARQVRAVSAGKRNLAVVVNKNIDELGKADGLTNTEDWSHILEIAVNKGISELGYFNQIDTGNYRSYLRGIEYNKLNLTKEAIDIGLKLKAESFLILQISKNPKIECKVEELLDSPEVSILVVGGGPVFHRPYYYGYHPYRGYRYYGRSYRYYPYVPYYYPEYIVTTSHQRTQKTGVIYVSIYVEGRLFNLKTNKTASHLYSETMRIRSEIGDQSCPSSVKAFEKLFKKAGYDIVSNLSPEMIDVSIPLLSSVDDIEDSYDRNLIERIEYLLEQGLTWAKSGSLKSARKSWIEAFELSKGNSLSARWNLAIYYWHMGELDKAKEYFDFLQKEKYSYLNSNFRDIITRFEDESDGRYSEE